jgi:hypothetical protein
MILWIYLQRLRYFSWNYWTSLTRRLLLFICIMILHLKNVVQFLDQILFSRHKGAFFMVLLVWIILIIKKRLGIDFFFGGVSFVVIFFDFIFSWRVSVKLLSISMLTLKLMYFFAIRFKFGDIFHNYLFYGNSILYVQCLFNFDSRKWLRNIFFPQLLF